jgi:beta-lactamase class A
VKMAGEKGINYLMRLAQYAAVAVAVCLLPLSGLAAERPLGAIAASLSGAERYAGSSEPALVQARYEAARAVEDQLVRHVPSARCRSAYRAVRSAARAHVTATEGVDRLFPAMRARGERAAEIARRRLARVLPRCSRGAWGRRVEYPAPLVEPLDGEAFFGLARARAPAGARRMEVVWNRRVVVRRSVASGIVTARLRRVKPGPGSLAVRFYRADGTLVGEPRADRTWLLPASARVRPARIRSDRALERRFAAIASGFSGYAGIWVHDLTSGRIAAWNENSRFPAASTVKLGVLAAALDRYGPRPERSPLAYDMQTIASWSSNLAANRLLKLLGRSLVEERLRRMGATRSTYPGEYRVGTSRSRAVQREPPLVSSRTTTARDLGRVLTSLHAAATGNARARAQTRLSRHEARVGIAMLLRSLPRADNVGLFRPALPAGMPAAQKHAWISSARHSAAVLYTARGPVVVVLLTYREHLTLSAAQQLAQRVLRAALSG